MQLFKTLLAAVITACASLSSFAAVGHMDVSGGTQVGQNLAVNVLVDKPFDGMSPAEELLFFGFTLDFDASLLKLTGYAIGPDWDDDTPIFNVPGNYYASAFPGLQNAGQASLLLATLNFEVLGIGSALVDVSSSLADPSLGLGYFLAGTLPLEARVSIPLVTARVPEPSTALLLGAALLGVVATRRQPR